MLLDEPSSTSTAIEKWVYTCIPSSDTKTRKGHFKKSVTKTLEDWMTAHLDKPIPSAIEKAQLVERTGLSVQQVESWFARARRRPADNRSNQATAGTTTLRSISDTSSLGLDEPSPWYEELGIVHGSLPASSLTLASVGSQFEWWFNTITVSASRVPGCLASRRPTSSTGVDWQQQLRGLRAFKILHHRPLCPMDPGKLAPCQADLHRSPKSASLATLNHDRGGDVIPAMIPKTPCMPNSSVSIAVRC